MIAEMPYHCYEEILKVDEKRKNSRKKSYAIKARKINPNCLIQNEIRKRLNQIIPTNLKSVDDNKTGIDYYFKDISIDQKFSFGDLGDNAIVIRTKNRRLINLSDWTMVISKEEKIEFFQTKKLENFVKRNWGIVQKNLIEKNFDHDRYKIQLDQFYKIEDIVPIETIFRAEELHSTLKQISSEEIDCQKKICILPLIIPKIQ